MTKMSKTQRTAIIDFHNGVTGKGHTMIVPSYRTADAMIRNGWARGTGHGRRALNVTTAGLIAAGVDMDAIHAKAIEANDAFDRTNAKYAQAMREVAEAQREMGEAAAHRATPAHRYFMKAVYATKGGYRAALDYLHAEALAEDAERAFEARRVEGIAREERQWSEIVRAARDRDHAEALASMRATAVRLSCGEGEI